MCRTAVPLFNVYCPSNILALVRIIFNLLSYGHSKLAGPYQSNALILSIASGSISNALILLSASRSIRVLLLIAHDWITLS